MTFLLNSLYISMYTAIVLDRASQNRLVKLLSVFVEGLPNSNDWDLRCEHCTLAMEGLTASQVGRVDRTLTIDAFAFNDLVAAFRVRGADDSRNVVPHVTALVNVKRGGKARMSNDLTDWRAIQPVTVTGKVHIIGTF